MACSAVAAAASHEPRRYWIKARRVLAATSCSPGPRLRCSAAERSSAAAERCPARARQAPRRHSTIASPGRAGPGERTDPIKTRSEEHTSELQSHLNLVCRLLLE